VVVALAYLINRKGAKIQVIQAIKFEIINTDWYLKLHEDDDFKSGYSLSKKEQWIKKYGLLWANPLAIPNPINITFVQNYSLLPGIGYMGDQINQLMAGYLQWCIAYNNFLLHIRAYLFSRGAEKNAALAKKYSYNSSGEMVINTADLTQEEREFVNMVISMYINLFFEIVGDESKGHLYTHHDSIRKSLDEYEKSLGLFF
jgi:hypothetical protein